MVSSPHWGPLLEKNMPTREHGDEVRAVLVSVVLPTVTDEEAQASLDELERLASTVGLRAVVRLTQRRLNTGAATVLGGGKLQELSRWTHGPGVVPLGASRRQKGAQPPEPSGPAGDSWVERDEAGDVVEDGTAAPPDPSDKASVVLFDHDLTPSQLRNLEGATSAEVLDRSSLILRIFHRHARTHEARLQVEIAQLKYLAPRLRSARANTDRQRGGIGGKGAGESALELDRRRVRDRIALLEQRLVVVRREARTRSARRGDRQAIALVGYTNAGKSSLMRRLTLGDVLVQDQLFATLDTTVRQLQPPVRPAILVSDTVGFIKRLPHDLIASFRSTLEEVRGAGLLVHVVDASDPEWRSQLEVTRTVLAELDGVDCPILLVFNKADRLTPEARVAFADAHPQAMVMSAQRPADVSALHQRIVTFFQRGMIDAELFVPYGKQRLVHKIHQACGVMNEVHDEEGTRIFIRAPEGTVNDLRQAIDYDDPSEGARALAT